MKRKGRSSVSAARLCALPPRADQDSLIFKTDAAPSARRGCSGGTSRRLPLFGGWDRLQGGRSFGPRRFEGHTGRVDATVAIRLVRRRRRKVAAEAVTELHV